MDHYDDLQRFKDKTRNQKHDFKDLSAQTLANDQGNWAIINQLSPATEESTLAMGGHVSLVVPQSVDPQLFATQQPVAEVKEETPATTHSLLQEVASQLDAKAPAVNVVERAPAAPVPINPLPSPAAPSAGDAVNYARLFAPKAAEAKPRAEKNQPLKTLLERIASCR